MSGPTLATERDLIAGGAPAVIGMDEVGRGALAGPVCVGAVCVGPDTPEPPLGVADSKALSPPRRVALAEELASWGRSRSLGWASAAEVDRHGILGALRQAGRRALAALGVPSATVLLDGRHDWLSAPPTLTEAAEDAEGSPGFLAAPLCARVVAKVRADVECSSVAAASIVAKVARDEVMRGLAREHPGYGWESNKGYGSAAHRRAIAELGASVQHRRTWRLGGGAPAAPSGER